MHCRQAVSDEVLRSSDIYKKALAPLGIEYAMCLTVPIEQELSCFLGVMRGPHLTPFSANDCADFSCLAPHVGRAATMHGAFQRCRDELAMVKALIDGVPLGMMVVGDDELKVANRAARTLLEEGDAVRLHNGRLRGATRRADADLQDAVREARSGTDQPIGLALPIDHAEPMRAVIRRLPTTSASMLGAPREAVALYVTDPRKPVETPQEILQRLFGLHCTEGGGAILADGAAGEQGGAPGCQLYQDGAKSYQARDGCGARRCRPVRWC